MKELWKWMNIQMIGDDLKIDMYKKLATLLISWHENDRWGRREKHKRFLSTLDLIQDWRLISTENSLIENSVGTISQSEHTPHEITSLEY